MKMRFNSRYGIASLLDLPEVIEAGNIRGIKKMLQEAADKKRVAGKKFKPAGTLVYLQPTKNELRAFLERGKLVLFASLTRE